MSTAPSRAKRAGGEPAWEVAELFPAQGEWSESDYLSLPGNRLIELSDGRLEFLPMPTTSHQLILGFLFQALVSFVKPRKLGAVSFAGLPVRLWEGKFREPDLVFLLGKHADRIGEQYWQGADLVMEVVSSDAKGRERDLKTKRREYARAGIPEYWVVDPREGAITVLRLKGGKYVVHGRFARGGRATSALLKGFEVDVDAVLSPEGA